MDDKGAPMKKKSVPSPALFADPSPVPLFDVDRQNGPLRAELIEAMTRVIDSGA